MLSARVDCTTREAEIIALSADEVAMLEQLRVDAQAQQEAMDAAATQRATDQQAVIAGLTALGQPDAAAALARLLGL